jgi:hypothetical protein
MQFWSILSTFRGTFGALLVWIQRSHLLSKGLRCQGGRTEFRKGSPSWQPCPKKDVNYMLLLLQRWGSKPVIVLTGFFGWRSSCTTAMMYQVLTPKNAQEMPLAIVAWHWRVASRWSGDDPGAGKLVATDWIGTRLLWGYWHLKKLEHVLTKNPTLKTYLQLPPAQKPKEPKKILLEHEWYSSQYGHCLVLSLILRVLCDLSNIIFQGDEHTKISQGR